MSGTDVVFIGDVHLDREDPDLVPFCSMLRGLGGVAGRIVLLGDLFNLWIASPEFESDHHRIVLEAIADARAAGSAVDYVEGNRDYRIASADSAPRFDRVASGGLDVVTSEGFRIHAVHGDLANRRDRQYRVWRRLSRSTPFWWSIRLLPKARRASFAESLEQRMRVSNVRFKRRFPASEVRRYGTGLLRSGRGAVVLGHFHEQHVLDVDTAAARGRIVVLPLWKDGHVHATFDASGSLRFESFSDVAG